MKNMKIIFSFLILLIFCLNANSHDCILGKIKPKDPAKQNTVIAAQTNIIQIDSIANYSIKVKGESNSVQITSDTICAKSQEADSKQKDSSNTIDINGAGNSININQSNNNGKVNINQKGNRNKINISQSIPNSEK